MDRNSDDINISTLEERSRPVAGRLASTSTQELAGPLFGPLVSMQAGSQPVRNKASSRWDNQKVPLAPLHLQLRNADWPVLVCQLSALLGCSFRRGCRSRNQRLLYLQSWVVDTQAGSAEMVCEIVELFVCWTERTAKYFEGLVSGCCLIWDCYRWVHNGELSGHRVLRSILRVTTDCKEMLLKKIWVTKESSSVLVLFFILTLNFTVPNLYGRNGGSIPWAQ